MNERQQVGRKTNRVRVVVVALILLVGAIAQAQQGDDLVIPGATIYDLPWWTVDGGGGTSSKDGFAVSGTVGQPDTGIAIGGPFAVGSGFWGNERPGEAFRRFVYAPVAMKNSLHVPYFEGPLESEDNDSYTEANGSLYSGRDYQGYPNDARDYFGVYLPTNGKIIVDLTNHTGSGVQLQLFYQSIDVRVTYVLAPPYHIEYTGAAGWYYIYIYTAAGYNSKNLYTLRVSYP